MTGGKKGVGEAIVCRFELSGASVATTARSAPAPGLAPAVFIQADRGTARGVQTSSIAFSKSGTGLDVLVNNVGGTETRPGRFEVLSDEDWLPGTATSSPRLYWESFAMGIASVRLEIPASANLDLIPC